MKRAAFAAILLTPLLAAADAPTQTIIQLDRHFSAATITVERGGKIAFVNRDDVRHNIAYRTPAGEEETGVVQEPGVQTVLTFDEAGTYHIHCLIHPHMKMLVVAQ